MKNKLSRGEWDALSADEQYEYMRLCEDGYNELYDLVRLIPPCPVHGDQCIPHAREWIRKQRDHATPPDTSEANAE